jgi:hypothetical protein
MSERELAERLERGINDLRFLLLGRRLQGEKRQAVEQELLTLRLARAGVFCRGQRAVLARHGIHGRTQPLLRRGPWPGHRIRIVG